MSTQDSIFQVLQRGDYEKLKKLLQTGADPNIEDAAGNTPLYYACQKYLPAHIEILIKYGADIYHRDKYGICPLRDLFDMHLDNPYDRVIEDYLQGYDINRLDAYGVNILHYAVYLGAGTVVDSLLPRADLSVRTAGGMLPVEIAIGMGFDDIAELLRKGSPEPRKELPPRLGTQLNKAVAAMDSAKVQELIAAGASVEGADWGILAPDGYYPIPLHTAITSGAEPETTERMVRLLLAAGANVNRADYHNNTALHLAVRKDAAPLARILLEAGADVTARHMWEGTPLETARRYGASSAEAPLVEQMQARGLSTEPAPQEALEGTDSQAGLRRAVYHGDGTAVRRWVDAGADIMLRDRFDVSPLSIMFKDYCATQDILPALTRVASAGLDKYGFHALHYAAYSGQDLALRHLIYMGVPVDMESANGLTALDIATSMESKYTTALLRTFTKRPARKLRRLERELMKAAKACDLAQMKELLAAGANPDGDAWGICVPWMHTGFTPLMNVADSRASDEDTVEGVRMLLEAGANPHRYEYGDWNAMHSASASGKPEALRLLFQACGKEDLWWTAEDWSVITIAIRYREPEIAIRIIKVLLECGHTFEEERPFHDIVEWEPSVELARFLLDAGADINALHDGQTPLDFALAVNEPELADFFRANGGKTAAELKNES